MVYAYTSAAVNGVNEVVLRRDSANKIVISTVEPLTDDQAKDLYLIAYAMLKTGKRAGELLRKEDENE